MKIREEAPSAQKDLKADYPIGHVEVLPLDLMSFDSVCEFAEKAGASSSSGIHALVNNAGIWAMV